MTKVKILFVGPVGVNVNVLQDKLESLQGSKAGPFDACFCVGDFQVLGEPSFPLPVYIQEYSGPLSQSSTSDGGSIITLGKNLFYLLGDLSTREKAVQFLEIKLPNQEHELVIACCSKRIRLDTTVISTQQQCDILLSSDWPQGMEDVVNVDTEPLSFDVAQVVLQCRPRYHVAPSSQHFHQSPPFAVPDSDHVGRFLALAPVLPGKASKTAKYIHALGLTPLSANPPPTMAPSTLPCPFVSTASLESSSTSMPLPGFVSAVRVNDSGAAFSRFATSTRKRHRDEDNDPISLEPPDDPNVKTLFLYGLHKDVTGQLQSTINTDNSNHKVFQAFAKFGITHILYPPNAATSTYCFLEFPDQKSALACLVDCQGRIVIESIPLTLKWATPGSSKKKLQRPSRADTMERHYVTQAEATNSTTLFFHPPKDKENDEEFANTLCHYLQQTLEDALNEGNDDDTERVTAETEPALKVSVRRKDHYGFLEFASHAAATMALAAVTQSTDGGLVKDLSAGATKKQPSLIIGTTMRWAKGEAPKTKREEILEALGLERHYFAADTRTDCWFCLASPTCETHLITGVYKDWYATMPKGPVHPGHVLLVPVTHTRQGAWTLHSTEWTELIDRLAQHASEIYNCDLFVFERAMETKGGYHSHVNCVPIPRNKSGDTNDSVVMQLQTTMMAHAKASGFKLRPIQSDLGTEAVLSTKTSDSQYFYAEIRTPRQAYRFLYQHDEDASQRENGGNRITVPLQFAREVLAAVLKNPKLAHWKSCVLDKEQEMQFAKNFRESFQQALNR